MKNKQKVYDYVDYLTKNHIGKENAICRNALAKKMGVSVVSQKIILRQINSSLEFDIIISRTSSIYVCRTKEECWQEIEARFDVGKAYKTSAGIMAKKVNLEGQYRLLMNDNDICHSVYEK